MAVLPPVGSAYWLDTDQFQPGSGEGHGHAVLPVGLHSPERGLTSLPGATEPLQVISSGPLPNKRPGCGSRQPIAIPAERMRAPDTAEPEAWEQRCREGRVTSKGDTRSLSR